MSALVAALEHAERDTGLSLRAVMDLEPYWEAVRRLYRPFESGLPGPTGRVYDHEIPGGQLSNLRQQAIALGLGDRFEQIEAMYAAADGILGRLVKVTPSSKVVGDLALHLVARGADPAHFARAPGGVRHPGLRHRLPGGELGDPPGGWPEPFRTSALAGRAPAHRHARRAERAGPRRPRRVTPRPGVTGSTTCCSPARPRSSSRCAPQYGDVSVLDTAPYLYGMTTDDEVKVQLDRGVRPAHRHGGRRRAGRAGHAHRDVHPQRAAAAAPGARPLASRWTRRLAEKADPGAPGTSRRRSPAR